MAWVYGQSAGACAHRGLLQIMQGIHAACLKYGKRADGSVSYIDGANVAGFVKVADAMLAQGVV